MPTGRTDYIRNLDSAFRLARFELGAIHRFDLSEEGFWRSFRALGLAVLLGGLSLHLFTIGMAAHHQPGDPPPLPVLGWTEGVGLYALGGAVSAAVFVVGIGIGAWYGGLRAGFVPFVIASNWVTLLMAGVGAAISLLYAGGVLPEGYFAWAGVILLCWSVTAGGIVAHAGLAGGPWVTGAVVLYDFVVTNYVTAMVFVALGIGA